MEDSTTEDLIVIRDAQVPEGYQVSAPKNSARFWRKKTTPAVKADPGPDDMDMDVNDDDDSDGGVQLDSSSLGDSSVDPHKASELRSHYCQDPTLDLQNMKDMWQLPVPSSSGLTRIEIKTFYGNAAHMRHYQQSCRTIRSAWGCDAENCLPDNLRTSTPYSLTLLRLLRRLAKLTQGHPEEAQRLLDKAYGERYRDHGLAGRQVSLEIVETNRIQGNNCEPVVRENLFGLMVADVLQAINAASRPNTNEVAARPRQAIRRVGADGLTKAERRKLRQQAEMRMDLGGASQLGAPPSSTAIVEAYLETSASVAERVTRKRRQQKVHRFTPLQQIDEDPEAMSMSLYTDSDAMAQATVPPNSPVNTGTTFQLPLRPSHNATLGQSDRRVPQQAYANSGVTPTNTPRTGKKRAKGFREGIGSISCEFDNVLLGGKTTHKGPRLKPRRIQQLEAGGWSRERGGDGRMPSERLDLNSLPTLHALAAAATSQNDLEKLGQLALPD